MLLRLNKDLSASQEAAACIEAFYDQSAQGPFWSEQPDSVNVAVMKDYQRMKMLVDNSLRYSSERKKVNTPSKIKKLDKPWRQLKDRLDKRLQTVSDSEMRRLVRSYKTIVQNQGQRVMGVAEAVKEWQIWVEADGAEDEDIPQTLGERPDCLPSEPAPEQKQGAPSVNGSQSGSSHPPRPQSLSTSQQSTSTLAYTNPSPDSPAEQSGPSVTLISDPSLQHLNDVSTSHGPLSTSAQEHENQAQERKSDELAKPVDNPSKDGSVDQQSYPVRLPGSRSQAPEESKILRNRQLKLLKGPSPRSMNRPPANATLVVRPRQPQLDVEREGGSNAFGPQIKHSKRRFSQVIPTSEDEEEGREDKPLFKKRRILPSSSQSSQAKSVPTSAPGGILSPPQQEDTNPAEVSADDEPVNHHDYANEHQKPQELESPEVVYLRPSTQAQHEQALPLPCQTFAVMPDPDAAPRPFAEWKPLSIDGTEHTVDSLINAHQEAVQYLFMPSAVQTQEIPRSTISPSGGRSASPQTHQSGSNENVNGINKPQAEGKPSDLVDSQVSLPSSSQLPQPQEPPSRGASTSDSDSAIDIATLYSPKEAFLKATRTHRKGRSANAATSNISDNRPRASARSKLAAKPNKRVTRLQTRSMKGTAD